MITTCTSCVHLGVPHCHHGVPLFQNNEWLSGWLLSSCIQAGSWTCRILASLKLTMKTFVCLTLQLRCVAFPKKLCRSQAEFGACIFKRGPDPVGSKKGPGEKKEARKAKKQAADEQEQAGIRRAPPTAEELAKVGAFVPQRCYYWKPSFTLATCFVLQYKILAASSHATPVYSARELGQIMFCVVWSPSWYALIDWLQSSERQRRLSATRKDRCQL